jgi:pimeloyl-ACP methyl ester carboxylesterase
MAESFRRSQALDQSRILEGVHVRSLGEGRRIVFVHGWRLDSTVDEFDFEDTLDAIGVWRRIYFDLPGMGQSRVRSNLKTMTDYAVWLSVAIEELCDNQPRVIVGTSAGAALALAALQSAPGKLRGLMLRMPRMASLNSERRVSHVPLPTNVQSQREAKKHRVWRPAQERRTAYVQELRDSPERYALTVPKLEIKVPSLIVTGRQDSRVGYEEAFALVERMPRCTFVTIDQADHEYPYGERSLFNALVADWLRRVDTEWH